MAPMMAASHSRILLHFELVLRRRMFLGMLNDPAQWRAAEDAQLLTDAQSARPLEQVGSAVWPSQVDE